MPCAPPDSLPAALLPPDSETAPVAATAPPVPTDTHESPPALPPTLRDLPSDGAAATTSASGPELDRGLRGHSATAPASHQSGNAADRTAYTTLPPHLL